MTTPNHEEQRLARLEATAAARAMLDDDQAAVDSVIDGSDNPRELAAAAIGMAGSVIAALVPQEQWARILEGLTAAAIQGT